MSPPLSPSSQPPSLLSLKVSLAAFQVDELERMLMSRSYRVLVGRSVEIVERFKAGLRADADRSGIGGGKALGGKAIGGKAIGGAPDVGISRDGYVKFNVDVGEIV
eukprot:CAMPEP_0118633666 /NCGR_PEP_ID=MMETSP0785-20121206/1123_1 /TAXON_ID=91992 /ORGANISM="Bolidomonas pacifica, Strain CCMP 1866" /LENGTH=105 /DNA_ID=CAMNT_0006524565 /DNA_START=95 /DNA_END=409 /DNA_ORIENTATION=+